MVSWVSSSVRSARFCITSWPSGWEESRYKCSRPLRQLRLHRLRPLANSGIASPLRTELHVMSQPLGSHYLDEARRQFRGYKRLAEGAIAQLKDEELFITLDPEANSIAVIMKHIAGNMRSRFTDFLTTDGEKPDRNRDAEFLDPPSTREALMALWEEGWTSVFQALEPLSDDDLKRSVTIRGEAHSVMQAINRQTAHYAYHCGQIVFLAKHFKASEWKSLSVPRNKSAEFNRKVLAGEASQR